MELSRGAQTGAWRKSHPVARNATRKRNYAKSSQDNPNRRQYWTIEAAKAVMAHEIPDRELAVKLGRSVQAIQVFRSKAKRKELK